MTLAEFLAARLDEDEAARNRFDLQRQLREVAAKRAIMTWHLKQCTCSWTDDEGYELGEDVAGYGCPTLLMLAAIYKDHPDYRQEWKP